MWSPTSLDVSASMRPHILHVNRSRTRTDQRSFCHLLVLYQARHACAPSRKRLRCRSSPDWLASLGGSLSTSGLIVESLVMTVCRPSAFSHCLCLPGNEKGPRERALASLAVWVRGGDPFGRRAPVSRWKLASLHRLATVVECARSPILPSDRNAHHPVTVWESVATLLLKHERPPKQPYRRKARHIINRHKIGDLRQEVKCGRTSKPCPEPSRLDAADVRGGNAEPSPQIFLSLPSSQTADFSHVFSGKF